jgi:transcriptional regulator GlxA family with amidase domain
MVKIGLLVYEDVVLSSVSGAVDLLMVANGVMQQQGLEPIFEVQLISARAGGLTLQSPAVLQCNRSLADDVDADVILIPAFNSDPVGVLSRNGAAVEWLKAQYEGGRQLASLCFGAYFLAEAGLLQGKDCCSHWLAIPDLQLRYPGVTFLPDTLMTENAGIYTSGGALLSWNLVLYLIEKFGGRDLAIAVSKMFNIDLDRGRQSHFTVFSGQRRHGDAPILKAQDFIEQRYQGSLSVEQIAGQAFMSKRNFIRRFKLATGNTPLEYIQRVKIEAAKKQLENSDADLTSVMLDAGYNDVKAFRKVFRQVTGMTPQDYRRKFSRVGGTMV